MRSKGPNHEQAIPEKSHCKPLTQSELELLKQKYGARKRRFSRAARLSQIMYVLTACGAQSMRSLAQIIAGYTGEDSEVVRRILYRHLKLLTDLWFVEKKGKKLRITPIGLYVIANFTKDIFDAWLLPHIPFWIASRIEEWEKSLCGLRVFLENLNTLWYIDLDMDSNYQIDESVVLTIRGEETYKIKVNRPPNLTEKEVLYQLLNFYEIEPFNSNNPVQVLHNIFKLSLKKELSSDVYRKVANLLKSCSSGKCPQAAPAILIENLFEQVGLLSYLDKLNPELVERMTGWPEGKPPVTAVLALIATQELLSVREVEDIINSLRKSEDNTSEFLATILVAYSLDQLMDDLSELARDIQVVSKYKNSVIPRVWAFKDERYRELLSAILMLDKVLNEELEFSRESGESQS